MFANVRLWPIADIGYCTAHVRFWGQSRHGRLRESAFAVAIGCKADMLFALHMSACDPKRASADSLNDPHLKSYDARPDRAGQQ
jgi:hypothetical protein